MLSLRTDQDLKQGSEHELNIKVSRVFELHINFTDT